MAFPSEVTQRKHTSLSAAIKQTRVEITLLNTRGNGFPFADFRSLAGLHIHAGQPEYKAEGRANRKGFYRIGCAIARPSECANKEGCVHASDAVTLPACASVGGWKLRIVCLR